MTKETKKANVQVKEQKVTKSAQNKKSKTSAHTQVDTHTHKSTIDKKLVIKLFNKGMTAYQIAKQIGKYYSQVAPILEKEGLTWKKRPAGPTDKKSRTIYCNEEQYKFIKDYLKNNK